jgi:hypothetical protein
MYKFIAFGAAVGLASAQDDHVRVRMDKVDAFAVRDEVMDLKSTIESIEAKIAVLDRKNKNSMDAIGSAVEILNPSIKRVDQMVNTVAGVKASMVTLQKTVNHAVGAGANALTDEINTVGGEISAARTSIRSRLRKVDEFKTTLEAAGTDASGLSAVTAIDAALKLTHLSDPSIPVFRWFKWDTYNQNCCWIDQDKPRAFGGVRPQQWGDGNYRAQDMSSDLGVMRRLFTRTAFGDAEKGANVCMISWMMPHSTDDRRCGALFRIKNTGTSSKTWNMHWVFTGWSGWGNQASVAVNKQNVWHGGCHHDCERSENIPIPANGDSNRISTVIFISGGTHPYGHYNQYRSNILSFNRLTLPSGLEFINDLDTAAGSWN